MKFMGIIKIKYMRYCIVIAFIFFICLNYINAQAPKAFNYQAVVRDNDGKALINEDLSFRVRLLEGLLTETEVYAETHDVRTNKFGLVNLKIGDGTVESGSMDDLDWANNTYIIQIEIADLGSTDFQILGKSQLVAVPYAFYADRAGNVFSGDYNDLVNSPNLSDTSMYLKNETDPVFEGSTAFDISESDIDNWNAKSDFSGDYVDLNNAPDLSDTALYLKSEADPVFVSSVANGIKGIDTANWNAKSDFSGDYNDLLNSPNLSDTANYLKLESDPLFASSVAQAINQADTAEWNNKSDFSGDYNDLVNAPDLSDTSSYLKNENDPVFTGSLAYGISASDTMNWNNKLSVETDGSITNELQQLTLENDSLKISNGNGVSIDSMRISPWNITGNHIYYDAGNVGIGETNPDALLHIVGSGTYTSSIIINRPTNSMADNIGMQSYVNPPSNSSYNTTGLLGVAPSGVGFSWGVRGLAQTATPTSSGRAYGVTGTASNATNGYNFGIHGNLFGSNDGAAVFGRVGTVSDFVSNGQWAGYFLGKVYIQDNLGIGTTLPQRSLHVNDVLRLEPRSTAPSSPSEGDMYMDSSDHTLKVYDGTLWQNCW